MSNLIVDADLDMRGYALKTNTIEESTSAAGVTIDGALAKDGEYASKDSYLIRASDNTLVDALAEKHTAQGVLRTIYFPFPRILNGSTVSVSFEYKTTNSYPDNAHNFYLKTSDGTVLWSVLKSTDTYTPVTVSNISLDGVSYLYLETTMASSYGSGYCRNMVVKADAAILPSGCEIV